MMKISNFKLGYYPQYKRWRLINVKANQQSASSLSTYTRPKPLINYPDSEIVLDRTLFWSEELQAWFLDGIALDNDYELDTGSNRTLCEVSPEFVQIEIYLMQHSMNAEQLILAEEKGFNVNKEIKLEVFDPPAHLVNRTEMFSPGLRAVRISWLDKGMQPMITTVNSIAELLTVLKVVGV